MRFCLVLSSCLLFGYVSDYICTVSQETEHFSKTDKNMRWKLVMEPARRNRHAHQSGRFEKFCREVQTEFSMWFKKSFNKVLFSECANLCNLQIMAFFFMFFVGWTTNCFLCLSVWFASHEMEKKYNFFLCQSFILSLKNLAFLQEPSTFFKFSWLWSRQWIQWKGLQ